MTSLRRVRDQVREIRAELAPGQQRLIAVSTAADADEVRARLRAGDDALIVITGVPRAARRTTPEWAGCDGSTIPW